MFLLKTAESPARPRQKRIWIDLDNSPHVPFFRPIIAELDRRGYSVLLTVRDCFQACELANLFKLRYHRIGRHYGKNKMLKMAGLLIRASQMAPMVLRQKPDLALSHGSRSQILLAALTGIPTMLIDDYEHSTYMPFLQPTWVMTPEVIPSHTLKNFRQGIFQYPGIKEDVYVPSFKPNSRLLADLGIAEEEVVVTVRPPATEAHYHVSKSEALFEAVIEFIGRADNSHMVILPRHEKQKALVQTKWPQFCATRKIIIPEQVCDGLNLIWHSDLVISGGGTMNREAAALGVPVYSIFCGKIGAVDKYLAERGRLILLRSVEEVYAKIVLAPRPRWRQYESNARPALQCIMDNLAAVLESC